MIQHHTLVKFILVGISNTLIGIGVIFIAWHFLRWGDLAANLTGYAVGIIWSYTLNRLWTFEHKGSVTRSLGRFLLVCAVAYAVNLAVLFTLRHLMGETSFLPHVFGMVAYTVVGYLGSRFFAFETKHPAVPPAVYSGEGIPPP